MLREKVPLQKQIDTFQPKIDEKDKIIEELNNKNKKLEESINEYKQKRNVLGILWNYSKEQIPLIIKHITQWENLGLLLLFI